MLFHAPEFIFVFLPVTVAGFFFIATFTRSRKFALSWLVLCSMVFYGWGIKAHVLLILGSALFNFIIAGMIHGRRQAGDEINCKRLLVLGVVANLCLLGYFKYFDFFAANVAALLGTKSPALGLILPLAISFFTLQQIAYLVDVRRGISNEKSLVRYLVFVTFFPQLIAGPIVHHSEMLPQFKRHSLKLNATDAVAGITIFLLGLFKKVVLADTLAGFADPVFAAADQGVEPSLFVAWGGTLAFSFQIYFDFSAYSDMAIGIARVFSIRLPMNFASPYQAVNIIEFWRRWHMTLSRFLKEYLYIPLGGNRRGRMRRHINLLATMVIGGLWHGAAWGFVIWGGLHGLFLSINHLWRHYVSPEKRQVLESSGIARVASVILTFAAVTVAWAFFRAETLDGAVLMVEGMVGLHGSYLPTSIIDFVPLLGAIAESRDQVKLLGGGTVLGAGELIGILVLSGIVVFLGTNLHDISHRARIALIVVTVGLSLQAVYFESASEFIYFRF